MRLVIKSWSVVLKDLRQTWRQVLLIHLVFAAMGFILFSPLIAGIGRLLILFSGRTALDDQDILYFFLSPFGLLAMTLMLALMITVLVFEQAALMRIAVGAQHGQRIGIVDAFLFAVAKVNRLFFFVVRLVARVLLLILPFMAIAFGIAWFLITDYDINYYISQRPAEFWWAGILIAAVLVAMLALLVRKLLAWSLALPLVLFDDESARRSFSRSAEMTDEKRSLIFISMAAWAALAILSGLILVGVIRLVGEWSIPFVQDSISWLVALLGSFSVFWLLGNFLITAFTSGSFAYLLIGFYVSSGAEPGVPPVQARWSGIGSGKFQFSTKRMTLALLASVIAAGLTGVWLIEGMQSNDGAIIIAHRGAAGKAPENTIAAFRQAIDDGADWIELDVQETADGEVVVFHDSDFMKLAGNKLKVWQGSLAEIVEIDVGSWFDPAFSNERVPTLKKVLEMANGKVNVVIELKYYGHDQMLEQRVVDIVEETGMVSHTAIMSLQYEALEKVRTLRPDWQLGLLAAKAIGDLTGLDSDFLAVGTGMAKSGFIRSVHRADKKVFVWTVNDPVSMSRMMSLGVDGIITDEPEMARLVLEQRKNMNVAERLLIHTALLFGHSYTPTQYRDDSP